MNSSAKTELLWIKHVARVGGYAHSIQTQESLQSDPYAELCVNSGLHGLSCNLHVHRPLSFDVVLLAQKERAAARRQNGGINASFLNLLSPCSPGPWTCRLERRDHHGLDERLRLRAQGPAHWHSQWKYDADIGATARILVFPCNCIHDDGSLPRSLLVRVDGQLTTVRSSRRLLSSRL